MAFNDFFIKASALDESLAHAILPNENRVILNDADLSEIITSENDVQDQIDILDVSKSYHPDEIPPRLIAKGGRTVSYLLTRMFKL